MYYNLTEDQKIFLETSYSMIKAGYTLEEVEEFWSSEDEDNVKNILESVDYVDIDRKDADLQEVVGIGARILGGIGLALKGARTARRLNQLRKIAQMAKPTAAQRATALQLKKSLGQSADDVTFAWRQAPKDKLGQAVTKTTGADDVLKTVRPGSSGSATVRGSASSRPTEVIQQQTAAIDRQTKVLQQTVKNTKPTTTAAATTTSKVTSKLPKKPPTKVSKVRAGLLGTAVTAGALLYTPSSEKSDTPAVTSCGDNMKRDANGNCVPKVQVGDTVGGDDMQSSSSQQQTTTQQQPPTTTTTQQQTPPTTQPSSTPKKRISNRVDWRSWQRQNLPR
tara:strand:+ start:496 stop:1503 length:1008 start_codon:yes stop_codon:yes gene_type:complete